MFPEQKCQVPNINSIPQPPLSDAAEASDSRSLDASSCSSESDVSWPKFTATMEVSSSPCAGIINLFRRLSTGGISAKAPGTYIAARLTIPSGPPSSRPLARKVHRASRSQGGPGTPPGSSFCGGDAPADGKGSSDRTVPSRCLIAPGKKKGRWGAFSSTHFTTAARVREKQQLDAGTASPWRCQKRRFLRFDQIDKQTTGQPIQAGTLPKR